MRPTLAKSSLFRSISLSMVAIGVLLVGCVAPPIATVSDTDLRPTVEALVEEVRQLEASLATPGSVEVMTPAAPPTFLEIRGLGEVGSAVMLHIAPDETIVLPRLNDQAMQFLTKTYSPTAYLEQALVFNGPHNWLLYSAQPLLGMETANQTQTHFLELADDRQSLFASDPAFAVTATRVISITDDASVAIPLSSGIGKITQDLCPMGPPPGRPICRETAYLLLTTGEGNQSRLVLVIFGPVQPDGTLNPGFPGGCDDLVNYCANSDPPPKWCKYVVKWCN